MLARIGTGISLVRHLGFGWAWNRVAGVVEARLGLLARQDPQRAWREWDPGKARRAAEDWRRSRGTFFFSCKDRAGYCARLRSLDASGLGPLPEAQGVREGRFRYFSHHEMSLGQPVDWLLDPWTGRRASTGMHWSKVRDDEGGDIKVIWEPSRFAWVYALVRAYWRTGDESHAELFWRLLGEWRDANPPGTGPNWRCGQEATFRAMALCFALWGFEDAASSTDERVASLLEVLEVTGKRIECHLSYALSQRNNHGVSEAMGLFMLGTLLPNLDRAARWESRGRRLLEDLAGEVIYPDGGFSQHSFNYQRVMLHDYAWAMRLATLAGRPLGGLACERVRNSARLMATWTHPANGSMPNHGGNDGALVLPLDNSGYGDFRAASQVASLASGGPRFWDRGPWDESELWMFGDDARGIAVEPLTAGRQAAQEAGYHGWNGGGASVFMHVPQFRHRPSHADILHCDIMLEGIRLSLDPGSYSYRIPPSLSPGLASVMHHGTVSVDGQEPMSRVSRFIWLPWPGCRMIATGESGDGESQWMDAEHDGYQRLADPVMHVRRVVRIGSHTVVVLDVLEGCEEHEARLHWLLPAEVTQDQAKPGWLQLGTAGRRFGMGVGCMGGTLDHTLVRSDPASLRGWQSPRYQWLQPAASWASTARGSVIRPWSVFTSREDAHARVEQGRLLLESGPDRWALAWPGCRGEKGTSATPACRRGWVE